MNIEPYQASFIAKALNKLSTHYYENMDEPVDFNDKGEMFESGTDIPVTDEYLESNFDEDTISQLKYVQELIEMEFKLKDVPIA